MVIKISYHMKKRLLHIICLALCFYSTAQIFNPEIGNYGIEDYGAENQNWSIDVDNGGIV